VRDDRDIRLTHPRDESGRTRRVIGVAVAVHNRGQRYAGSDALDLRGVGRCRRCRDRIERHDAAGRHDEERVMPLPAESIHALGDPGRLVGRLLCA
jgi:hypothetical protein